MLLLIGQLMITLTNKLIFAHIIEQVAYNLKLQCNNWLATNGQCDQYKSKYDALLGLITVVTRMKIRQGTIKETTTLCLYIMPQDTIHVSRYAYLALAY